MPSIPVSRTPWTTPLEALRRSYANTPLESAIDSLNLYLGGKFSRLLIRPPCIAVQLESWRGHIARTKSIDRTYKENTGGRTAAH